MSFVQLVLFPYANFVIFLLIVFYMGRKPLRAMAEKKRQDYQEEKQEGDRVLQKTETLYQTTKKALEEHQTELDHKMKAAGEDAKRYKERAAKETLEKVAFLKKESKQMIELAQNNAERSLQQALRQEVLNCVSKQVRGGWGEHQHQKFVESALAKQDR